MTFWTTSELAFLRANAALGAAALAALMGRSVGSVKEAARRQRVSLRRSGSRRGLLLGQPRALSLRELLPVGCDRKTAALVLARQEMDAQAALCPACARRAATVRSSGLCLACHRRRLADDLREVLAERDATRDHWQAKQALKRRRDRAATR